MDELDRSNAPGPGPLRPFQFPAIEHLELENGMPLLFARTEGLPVATFSLLVPGGALREPEDLAGVGTLTGAALESGTRNMDATEVAIRLEEMGVRLHAGTSWEISHVDFTCLASRASGGAAIAAELIGEPTFPEGEIERLRQQQLAGIVQRRAEPRGLANEMASRYIFAESSPFARPAGGTAESVARLTRDAVVDFHGRTFTPRASALIVAGNMDVEDVQAIAGSAFGGWKGDDPPAVHVMVEPRSDSVQVLVVERPGSVQSEIRIGHVGVARSTPDYFSILVMNTILGGAFSSRLNLNLREKHGFTYGVNSSFAMRKRPGPFLISTAVQTEVTGRAVSEILSELDRIRQAPVGPTELVDARQYLAGTYPLRLQTTDGIASRLADLFIYDLPDSYLEEFAERALAVSEEQVLEAARSHIRPDQLMILVVGAPDQIVSQLEQLNLGSIETVRVEVDA